MKRIFLYLSILTSAFFMLIAHVSVSIALEPSSHNQKPLSDYYTLSKRNFDMAPWLLTKKDNLTDYDRLLAFELLEVTIGNEDHAISNILHGFLRTAYASNGEYLPYATDLAPSTALLDYHRAGNIGGIYSNWRKGQNYRKQFENDYPWIESLLGSGTLAARMPGISKWSVPITVSIGLPNNLLPQGIKAGEAGSSVFMPINKNDDPRKEDLIFSTVNALIPELASLTGLSVTWVPPAEESSIKNYARIRIVLTDIYDTSKSVYRLYTRSPRPQMHDESFPPAAVNFRDSVENQMDTAVKFTPKHEAGLDG